MSLKWTQLYDLKESRCPHVSIKSCLGIAVVKICVFMFQQYQCAIWKCYISVLWGNRFKHVNGTEPCHKHWVYHQHVNFIWIWNTMRRWFKKLYKLSVTTDLDTPLRTKKEQTLWTWDTLPPPPPSSSPDYNAKGLNCFAVKGLTSVYVLRIYTGVSAPKLQKSLGKVTVKLWIFSYRDILKHYKKN